MIFGGQKNWKKKKEKEKWPTKGTTSHLGVNRCKFWPDKFSQESFLRILMRRGKRGRLPLRSTWSREKTEKKKPRNTIFTSSFSPSPLFQFFSSVITAAAVSEKKVLHRTERNQKEKNFALFSLTSSSILSFSEVEEEEEEGFKKASLSAALQQSLKWFGRVCIWPRVQVQVANKCSAHNLADQQK